MKTDLWYHGKMETGFHSTVHLIGSKRTGLKAQINGPLGRLTLTVFHALGNEFYRLDFTTGNEGEITLAAGTLPATTEEDNENRS